MTCVHLSDLPKARAFKVYKECEIFHKSKEDLDISGCEHENDYDTEDDETAKQAKLAIRRLEFAIKKLTE